MTAVTLRVATGADVEAMLAVSLAADLAEVGEPNTTAVDLHGLLATSTIRMSLAERGGTVVGHAWASHEPGQTRVTGGLTLAPELADTVGPVLLDWLRRNALELGPGLPLRTFADSEDRVKRRLFEAAGGRVIRHFYRMGVALDDPAEPRQPDAAGIADVASGSIDPKVIFDVVESAFADHFGHEPESYETWLEWIGTALPDRSLWWLATVGGTPAAALLACPLSETTGYIDTLGTLREFRGRGLGRALLLTAFAELARRGLTRAVLGVDSESPTGAVGLYVSAGMRPEHTGLGYLLPPLP